MHNFTHTYFSLFYIECTTICFNGCIWNSRIFFFSVCVFVLYEYRTIYADIWSIKKNACCVNDNGEHCQFSGARANKNQGDCLFRNAPLYLLNSKLGWCITWYCCFAWKFPFPLVSTRCRTIVSIYVRLLLLLLVLHWAWCAIILSLLTSSAVVIVKGTANALFSGSFCVSCLLSCTQF